MTFSEYTTRISTEPSYYGSECTQELTNQIVSRLTDMIKEQFPGINVETYTDGRGSGSTVGPDQDTVTEIDQWISENWTSAC